MAENTKIEWTDATWNPVTGCTKVSQGCKHCYAERDWMRLSANPATRYYGRDFTDVCCHDDVLTLPLRWEKPRKVFVNSMSDLFHPDVPFEFIAAVFAVMATANRHTYQVLTKRPARMGEFFRWLEASSVGATLDNSSRFHHLRQLGKCHWMKWPLRHVWIGVSVEDQATADERIPLLLQAPAAVRFLSVEPMLGPIDLTRVAFPTGVSENVLDCRVSDVAKRAGGNKLNGVDWVIVGGESGPKARPMHPDWVRGMRDQCRAADVPLLFKQWGEWLPRADAFRQNLLIGGGMAHHTFGDVAMARVGKKAAGRQLDGVTHDDYPSRKSRA